ncbi:hypothetical protein ACTFIW_003357 [Dictyostelium discoideum]
MDDKLFKPNKSECKEMYDKIEGYLSQISNMAEFNLKYYPQRKNFEIHLVEFKVYRPFREYVAQRFGSDKELKFLLKDIKYKDFANNLATFSFQSAVDFLNTIKSLKSDEYMGFLDKKKVCLHKNSTKTVQDDPNPGPIETFKSFINETFTLCFAQDPNPGPIDPNPGLIETFKSFINEIFKNLGSGFDSSVIGFQKILLIA